MKTHKPRRQVSATPANQFRAIIQGVRAFGGASARFMTLPNDAADIPYLEGNLLAAGYRKALLAPRGLDFFVQESVNRRRI